MQNNWTPSRGGISGVCGGGGPHDQNQIRSHFASSVLDALHVRVLGAVWKLQQWRRRFLEGNHRFDTAEEELNEKEIQKVRRCLLMPSCTEEQSSM